MHPDLVESLKAVETDEFYFWSGSSKLSSAVSDWHRTIERLARDLSSGFTRIASGIPWRPN